MLTLDADLTWLVAAVGLPFSLVITIVVCLPCFRKQTRFSDFSRNATASSNNEHGRVNTTFTMEIPDMDDNSDGPITIEPLPHIVSRAKAHPVALRPRITCVERTHQDLSLKLMSHHPFPRSRLTYLKELGTGWFGKVIESDAEKITTGVSTSRVVVKMLRDDASKEEQLLFLEEVAPFRELEHANVLRLLGQCTDMQPMLLILESAPLGNLKQYLRNHRHQLSNLIAKNRLIQFAIDASCGLACLHRHNYVHRDLATRNCLVLANGTLKVGDYGIAEEIFKEDYYSSSNELLPIRWMAPETLKQENGNWTGHNFTKESDIWSLGVLVWEITMLGERPYNMLTDEAVLQGVILDDMIRLPEPDNNIPQTDKLYEIMQQCWVEAKQRIKVDDVHRLLKQISTTEGSSTFPFSDFEKKWEHLVPNQRHMSIDSIDIDDVRDSRQVSVSSEDIDFLEPTLSQTHSQEVLAVSEEKTASIALPRMDKEKVTAVPEAAEHFSLKSDFARPAVTLVEVPSNTVIEFTDFTSHNATDSVTTIATAPVVPRVSAPDIVFSALSTSVDSTALEVAAGQNVIESKIVENSSELKKMDNSINESSKGISPGDGFIGLATPNKPKPKERKTSTPISKEQSPFASSIDSVSATFLTAQNSSSNSSENYATANDSTTRTEQDSLLFTDFSDIPDFKGTPFVTDSSLQEFDSFETTAVILPDDTVTPIQHQENSPSGKEKFDANFDWLNQGTPTSSTSSPTDTVDRDDSFGEFTVASDSGTAENQLPLQSSQEPTITITEGFNFEDAKSVSAFDFSQSLNADSFFQPDKPSLEKKQEIGVQEGKPFLDSSLEISPLGSYNIPTSSIDPSHPSMGVQSFENDFSSLGSFSANINAATHDQTPVVSATLDQTFFSLQPEDSNAILPDLQNELNTDSSGLNMDDFGFESFSSQPSTSFLAPSGKIDAIVMKHDNVDHTMDVRQSPFDDISPKANIKEQNLFGDFNTSYSEPVLESTPVQPSAYNMDASTKNVSDIFGFVGQDSFDIKGPENFDHLEDSNLSLPVDASSASFDFFGGFASSPAPATSLGDLSKPFSGGDGGLLLDFQGTEAAAAPKKVGNGVESHSSNASTASSEAESSSQGTDSDSTASDSGREYICEDPWSSDLTFASNGHMSDSEEEALQAASEIYLSKGLKLSRTFETSVLESIPEDPMPPCSEDSVPTPSETSSMDARFEETFEWDDFLGDSLVGKDQALEDSPRQSFEVSDWSLDVDSESMQSNASMFSQRSDDLQRNIRSDHHSVNYGETSNTFVSLSDSDFVSHGQNQTSKSYIYDLLANRTKGLSLATSSPIYSHGQSRFYSLYEDDFDLESDSQSESNDSPPLPYSAFESHNFEVPHSHSVVASPYAATNPSYTLNHDADEDIQDEDAVSKVTSVTDKSLENCFDFASFEPSHLNTPASGNGDLGSSSPSEVNGASLIDF